MIKKLRIKFILAAMTSVAAVLIVILGFINLMNYHSIIKDADTTLQLLADNNGVFPGFDDSFLPDRPEKEPEDRELPPALPEGLSPEAPYETRYFTILADENDNILNTDLNRIAAINNTSAKSYAERILASSRSSGFTGSYRFLVSKRDNTSLLLFLDCSRSLSTFHSFLIASIIISIGGILAVLILVIILSSRIVRPFSEAYEKQRRFITDAGHEIKTPLTIIDADVSVLEMDTGKNEWIEDIQKQTIRLRDLTNDLIYLSKMEENQSSVPMVDFPISETAEDVLKSFRASAVACSKTLTSNIEPMLDYHGDSKSIQRLFSILLDNALKYSQENGEISFSLHKKGKNLHIQVYNTCEFIDQAQLPHLFDRFYRTDQSRNSETGGHGIGLSIAQAIVTAHKGSISASTADGHSLQINITL